MKKYWMYGILILAFALHACVKEENAPIQQSFAPSIEPQISYWHLPLALDVAQIEEKINEKVRGTIYADTSYTNNNNDSIKLRIRKIGRIKLEVKGNLISWEVPLKIYFDGRIEKKVGQTSLQTYQKTDFSGNLYFESKISITDNWRLNTDTKLKDIEWLEKPTMKFGFLNLRVGKAVEKSLIKNQDKMLGKLDGVIRRQVNIRKHIEKVWQDIQKPIRINQKIRPVWLIARPLSLEVERIEGKAGNIYVYALVGLDLMTVVGEKPAIPINNNLPKASQSKQQRPANIFDLKILSEISYTHINEVLSDSLKGRHFLIEDQSIIVKDAHVSGEGKQLLIKLDVEGATEGAIFFRGTPVYDEKLAVLKVRDFDFDVESNEIVTTTADWLLHDLFKYNIQKQLIIPLDNQIDQIPTLIHESIEKEKVGKKISVKVEQLHLAPSQIVIQPNSIQMLLSLKGKAGIVLDEL